MEKTRQQLLLDLYQAYYDARRHKSHRSYVEKWEKNLKENMDALCDDLYTRRYKPLPSKCFIVEYPKKREIFAAMFRDRIVHHLYFNYTHELFERTFIADSYSCIRGRGTHYGISRITDMCRKESRNWQRKCYVLHLDIRGYFMHIDRQRLLEISLRILRKMSSHKSPIRPLLWRDLLDMPFIEWLTEQIALLDPRENCIIVGNPESWHDLDPAKSLLSLPDGIGLPIGNLTSQLFSNVYLGELDQYVKRTLHCRRYGRYVDDAAIVSADRDWLLSLIPSIRRFLKDSLGLDLHDGKLDLQEVHRGVEFLGRYIRPYRTYVSHHALRRMEQEIARIDLTRRSRALRIVNSYLAHFRHAATYRLRRRLFLRNSILRLGVPDDGLTRLTAATTYYKPYKNIRDYEQSIRA